MFVTAVVKKEGAHRFIDGETRDLEIGYEMRIDDVFSMKVDVTVEPDSTYYLVAVSTMDGTCHSFDAEYWDVKAITDADPFED